MAVAGVRYSSRAARPRVMPLAPSSCAHSTAQHMGTHEHERAQSTYAPDDAGRVDDAVVLALRRRQRRLCLYASLRGRALARAACGCCMCMQMRRTLMTSKGMVREVARKPAPPPATRYTDATGTCHCSRSTRYNSPALQQSHQAVERAEHEHELQSVHTMA